MGTLRTTEGEKRPDTIAERRRKIIIATFSTFVVLGALACAGIFIHVPQWVSASGFAVAPEYAEIRAGISGKILELYVASNANVNAGDVLLRFDAVEAQLALAEAEARVATSEANLKLIPKANQNVSLSEREVLVEKAQAEASIHQAALERSRYALNQHTTTAPFDGRVVCYSLYEGQPVIPSTLLYETFNGEVVTVKLRIPERHAAKVETGDRTLVEFGTHKSLIPIQFEGEITELRQVIEGDGSHNHQVAFARFDPKDTEILPGTSAEARILVGRIPLWQYLLQP